MIKILISIFHISVLFLIIFSLWPGSLFGYLFYGDWSQQSNLIKNPLGPTIEHFIYYTYLSLLGFFIYSRTENFKKIVYGLFFLAIILELLHVVVPNRAFQLVDLIGNISGVIVAYLIIKIYLFFNKS